MKNFRYLALLALLALPLAACDDAEEAPVVTPPVEGTIRGTVTLEGQAAQGITVTLQGGAAARTATTNTNGGFEFTAVSAGGYQVEIGNVPAGAAFSPTSRAAVISTAGQQVTVDFAGQFIRTSSIVGSVTASGVGQVGVTVSLTGTGAAQTTSNAQGAFSFTGLRAGTYTVAISGTATGTTFTTVSQNVTVGVGQAATVGFAGTLPAPAPKPATITIASITQGGTVFPVNLAGVENQIDVTLNIVPNDESPTKVNIFLAGIPAASQTIANAAPSEGAEESTAVQQITLSFNTAQFTENAAGTAATVKFPNGSHPLTTTLEVAQRPASQPRAGNTVQVTLVNEDFFIVKTKAVGASAASATNSVSEIWQSGALEVSASPVIYTPNRTVTQVAIGVSGGFSVADVDAASPFVITFPVSNAPTTGAGSLVSSKRVDGKEGEVVANVTASVATAVNVNTAGPTTSNGFDASKAHSIRLDNKGPVLSDLEYAIRGTGWINAAWSFLGTGTAPIASADAGVGDEEFSFNAGNGASTLAPVANGADLAETLDKSGATTSYILQIVSTDLLGNQTIRWFDGNSGGLAPGTSATTSVNGAAFAGRFGVDKTAPVAMFTSGSNPANDVIDSGSLNYNIQFDDPVGAAGGASGFDPDFVAKRARATDATRTDNCTGGTFTGAFGGSSCAFLTAQTVTTSGALSGNAYWQYETYITDRAGNRSATLDRRGIRDSSAPQIASIFVPGSIVGAQVMAFSASVTDNVQLGSADLLIGYAGLPGDRILWQPSQGLGQFQKPSAGTSGTVTTDRKFVRAVQGTTTLGQPVPGFLQATDVQVDLYDLAQNDTVRTQPINFSVARGNTAPANKTGFSSDWRFTVAVDDSDEDEVIFEASLFGPIAASGSRASLESSPWIQVGIFWLDSGVDGGVWRTLGYQSAASATTVTTNRTWDYAPITLAGAAELLACNNIAFVAIGIDASGDALISNVVEVFFSDECSPL